MSWIQFSDGVTKTFSVPDENTFSALLYSESVSSQLYSGSAKSVLSIVTQRVTGGAWETQYSLHEVATFPSINAKTPGLLILNGIINQSVEPLTSMMGTFAGGVKAFVITSTWNATTVTYSNAPPMQSLASTQWHVSSNGGFATGNSQTIQNAARIPFVVTDWGVGRNSLFGIGVAMLPPTVSDSSNLTTMSAEFQLSVQGSGGQFRTPEIFPQFSFFSNLT